MITLWDILRPLRDALMGEAARPAPSPVPAAKTAGRRPPSPGRKKGVKKQSQKDRYNEVAAEMLGKYDVRVRRWRKSMSGLAWQVEYRGGRIERLIESPEPRSPLSMAIFLHEIGHHAIGLAQHKPRCLEEYLAWKFSLEHMELLGLPVTDRVRTRVKRSLKYAVAKAQRRGLRVVPPELMPYAGAESH
jgi:hypothetical protein